MTKIISQHKLCFRRLPVAADFCLTIQEPLGDQDQKVLRVVKEDFALHLKLMGFSHSHNLYQRRPSMYALTTGYKERKVFVTFQDIGVNPKDQQKES